MTMTGSENTRIYMQDVTLRDGMHAIRHRYTLEQCVAIATALDRAGVAAIELSTVMASAGSSFAYGFGRIPIWNGSLPWPISWRMPF